VQPEDVVDQQHDHEAPGGASAETYQRILAAAERCMGHRGLRVSVNDVALEASLSRRTIYHYFPNRQALVGAVLRRTAAAFIAAVEPYVDRQPTLADQVAEAAVMITRHSQDIEFTLRLPQRSESLFATVLTYHLDHLTDSLVEFWLPRLEAAGERGELQPDLDHREVSEWLIRLTFSFTLMPEVVVDLDDDDAIRAFVRRYLRGITT
jgi:AcrR family transcriptional regulator